MAAQPNCVSWVKPGLVDRGGRNYIYILIICAHNHCVITIIICAHNHCVITIIIKTHTVLFMLKYKCVLLNDVAMQHCIRL